jgi:hypothetical protein
MLSKIKLGLFAFLALLSPCLRAQGVPAVYDVLVLQATPAGISAAISAARLGQRVLLLERTAYVGGLPANGLGATDIGTRELAGGFYKEYVDSIYSYYVHKYGATSIQVKHADNGFKFEPKAATAVFKAMLATQSNLELRTMQQFDPLPSNVQKSGKAIVSISIGIDCSVEFRYVYLLFSLIASSLFIVRLLAYKTGFISSGRLFAILLNNNL